MGAGGVITPIRAGGVIGPMGAGGPVGSSGGVAPTGPGGSPGSLDELLEYLTEYKDEDGRWVLVVGG